VKTEQWLLRASVLRPQNNIRPIATLLILGALFSYLLIWFSETSFWKEGNIYDYTLYDKAPTIVEGRQAHILSLGRMSPDNGVFVFVYSPKVVVRVEIFGSDGRVFYNEARNGSLSCRVFPDRTSDLTVRVTNLSGAKYENLESILYTEYSRYPYYELKILVTSLPASMFLVGLARYFEERLSVKGWFHLVIRILPTVALAFFTWYLYAFDIGGLSLSISAGIASLAFGLGVLYSLTKRD